MRTRQIMVAVVAASLLVMPGGTARAGDVTPSGYSVVKRQTLAPGIEYLHLKSGTPRHVHIAHLSGADARLKVVQSRNRISQSRSDLERPDALCRRVGCHVAINGDFITPKTAHPFGGVVTGGVMMRSPAPGRAQAWVGDDGRLGAGGLGFTGRIEDGNGVGFDLAGVNVDRVSNSVTLYTPAYGSKTPSGSGVVELVARAGDAGQIGRLGVAAGLTLVSTRAEGGTKILPGTVVISAKGTARAPVKSLWDRRDGIGSVARVRLATSPSVSETIGVHPVVLAGGKRVFPSSGGFYTDREPRTLLAWNRAGDVWFVTVDGRQKSSKGWSMAEAAGFVAGLGASDAVNFDGGGGTTFIVRGKVVNSPSDDASGSKPGSMRRAVNALTAVDD